MYAVVNKLTLAKPFDDALLERIRTEFLPRLRERGDVVELRLVNVSDSEVIILGFYESEEAMTTLSREIAGPWFAENVRPYLGGPVQRNTGEVVQFD